MLALLFLASLAAPAAGFPIVGQCPGVDSYFDVAGLQCASCGPNEVVSQSNDGCTCREGTFRFSNASANEPFDFGECRTCDGEDMVPSVTGRYCVQCDGTSGTEGIFDGGFRVGNDERWQPAIKSGDTCVCATPVANSVITEYGIHGTPFTSNGVLVMRCLVCPEGTIVHDGRCTACRHPTVLTADGQCSCGDIVPCFEEGKEIQYIADELNIFAQGAVQAVFNSVPDVFGKAVRVQVEESAPLVELQGTSGAECLTKGSEVACNALANLCVLQQYKSSTFACSVYEKLMTARRRRPYHSESVSSGGWSHTLPWLWYDSPPKQWLEAEDVQIRVQFSGGSIESGSVSLLPFILSAYALNGSWLGYQNLTDQFQICGAWKRHSTSWRRFGHNYINDCTLPLAEVGALIEAHGPPVFYELHLQDSPGSLYPVPIVLLGPGDEEGAVIEDEDTRLVRRFFFMDGDLGKARGGEDAAVVQFLEEFKLTVTLRGDGQIYAPRLTIRYAVRAPASSTTPQSICFKVSYKNGRSKTSSLRTMWLAVVAASLACGLVVLVIKVFQFALVQQSPGLDCTCLVYAAVKLADISGHALLFAFVSVSIFFWLMLFKLQREASVVVVEDGDVAGFRAAVFVAAVGQGLGLLHMLYRQVTYDIFFMDWEKPRRVLTRGGGREESAPVSCWRMLFVANEWNELQAVRKTSPAFTMLCMVLFLEGLHLSWAARMDPNEHNLDWNPYSQDSSLLRVGTDAGLFIFIAAVQLLYVGAFAQRFLLHPLAQFVDLLFLANISCIILDDKLAGYYLHGRNQSQFSDTSIVELNNALLQEEEGLVANRGLAAGNSTLGDPEVKENQTFQVYLTRAQRERYEGIMLEHMHSAARHQGSAQGLLRNGRKPSHRPKESALEARARILDDFKSLVVQIENNHAEQVLPSSFLGRILRLPPELSAQKAVLVHDFHSSFGNVLLYGNEVRLIMFELVMFCALDVSLKSPGIVAFLVYLISRLITWVRKSCGERNISRKTMVGRHFLM